MSKIPGLPGPRPPKVSSRILLTFIALIIAGAFGFGGALVESHFSSNPASLTEQRRIVTSQSQLISDIAKEVGPSVDSVNVAITTTGGNGFFDFGQSQQEEAAGTGIILSDSGYVMTNRHVVPAGTTKVSVTLSDGTELKDVSVVGRTSENDNLDVAFLKINNAQGHRLQAATIGDSSKVEVGDSVVAIGNALGQFQNTVTSGIISGYGRSVQAGDETGNSAESLDDLFQTDAAINEGNSGGPLVNVNDEVIGMNTAVAGDGAQNIGFSIPINNIRGMIDQVLKSGKFARPYLGVRYIALTSDIAKEYDLKVDEGAFIVPATDANGPSILSGGPAEKAGLQEKDVITAVDGKKVDNK